jgi:RNA polymerase sigma-70 factor (ECF subfamily)
VDPAERRRLHEDLTRLAAGDREAFHPVFAALRPVLRRFAAGHLAAEDAEDAAQEALVKVLTRASSFDPGRDALTWALTITAWEVRTVRRRRQRRREDGLDGSEQALYDGGQSPEAAAMAAARDAELREVLAGLSAEDRATLDAYARDERPPGLAGPTFRKRVERGLARLRRLWEATHGAR